MVTWQDGAIASPRPATEDELRAAERALRVPFPADFRAVAQAHPGAAPVPAKVDLPDGSVTSVAHLLHVLPEPGFSNIVGRMFPVAAVLKKGVIPFAEDIGGDLFCFSYRADFDHPPVGYWSVDTGFVRLAASFTEFIDSLHE